MAAASNWLLPTVLAFGCVALMINVYSAKKAGKSLQLEAERAGADLRIAMDKQVECTKSLEAKTAEVGTKNTEVTNLNNQINTLKAEKAEMEKKLNEATANLTKAVEEKKKVDAELAQLKNAPKPAEAAKPAETTKPAEEKPTEAPKA